MKTEILARLGFSMLQNLSSSEVLFGSSCRLVKMYELQIFQSVVHLVETSNQTIETRSWRWARAESGTVRFGKGDIILLKDLFGDGGRGSDNSSLPARGLGSREALRHFGQGFVGFVTEKKEISDQWESGRSRWEFPRGSSFSGFK